MTEKRVDLSWGTVRDMATKMCGKISAHFKTYKDPIRAYPIPRGGVYPAMMAAGLMGNLVLVDDPDKADVFIDDLVDSGATRLKWMWRYSNTKPFFCLLIKELDGFSDTWVSFPWERVLKEDGPQDNIRRLLQFIGEDQNREGLRDTPDRVVRSFEHLYSGYKIDPESVLTVFEDVTCDEMVVLKGAEFYSQCEHHMLPFFGKAHVAYIPDGKVVGISKLARILEIYSRRLQIQERICEQVTTALMDHLKPKGAACVLESKHLCMVARGVQKQNSVMVTSSLKGVFLEKPEARAEFFNIIKE